jgi:hypothetical protein
MRLNSTEGHEYLERTPMTPEPARKLIPVEQDTELDWDAPLVDDSRHPVQRIRVRLRQVQDDTLISLPPEHLDS